MTTKTVGLGLKDRWRQLHIVSPLGSNILLTTGANVILAGLGLITGPLAARLLGPAGRGELAAIQNLFWLGALLAMLGLPESALYFTAREPQRAGSVLATGILLPILVTPIVFVGMYPLTPLLLAAQPPQVVTAARWLTLGIPLYVLMAVPTFTLRGTNDLFSWNFLRLLPGVGWVVFLIGAWVAAKRSAVFLAGGYLLVLACLIVPVAILVSKLVPGPYVPSRNLLKPMLEYGLPQAGAAIPQTFNLRLDQLLIAALLPPYFLGLYVVAVAWSSAALPVLHAIGNVLFPKIADGTASAAERAGTLAQGLRLGTLTGVLLASFLVVLTPAAIPLLFGRDFTPAVQVGCVLVAATVISGMNVILEESLRGLGDTAGVFWGEMIGLSVTAVSLWLMLRPLGIMGAGLASVLGYSATCGFLAPRIRRNTGLAMTAFLLPRRTDLTLMVERMRVWRLAFRGVAG